MSKRVHSNVKYLYDNGYKTASQQRLIDSDMILILAYLEKFDGVYFTPEQKVKLMNATHLESITRESRILRSEEDQYGNKLYPESPGARRGRRVKEEQMRKQYSPIQDEYAGMHAFNQAVLGL